VIGALLAVGCLCAAVWWHRHKKSTDGRNGAGKLAIGHGGGAMQWRQAGTTTIANTLRAARTLTLRQGDGDGSIEAAGALEGTEGYLVVAGAGLQDDDAATGGGGGGGGGGGVDRMVTVQSRTNRTLSFLVPMEEDSTEGEGNMLTLQRPLPRTPAEYLTAHGSSGWSEGGGVALYSAPVEGQQDMHQGDSAGDAGAADTGDAAMYSAPVEGQQELYQPSQGHSIEESCLDGARMYSAPAETEQQLYQEGGEHAGGARMYSAPAESEQQLYQEGNLGPASSNSSSGTCTGTGTGMWFSDYHDPQAASVRALAHCDV
jgi:hypothetical protein